jgi:hypothetical protein
MGKPAVTNRPVVTLNLGILLELARLDKIDAVIEFCRLCQVALAVSTLMKISLTAAKQWQ